MKKLDPQIAKYLEGVNLRPPAHLLSVKELRREIDKLKTYYPLEPVNSIKDISIKGPAGKIKLRIYFPKGRKPFMPVVFFHGGGWCIGSFKSHGGICASLANMANSAVFSVDYRLAPENPFPAAVDDCYAALEYVSANAVSFGADPSRLVVMGDSAGGTLAAVMSLKARDEKGPKIASQVLVYPAADMEVMDTASYRRFGKGFDLDKEMMQKFIDCYVPNKKDLSNPYVSPGLAKSLKRLARTLIITAECDPLRDDARMFAAKLKKSGVPVKYSMYRGVIHGFLSFITFRAARKAIVEIASFLDPSCTACKFQPLSCPHNQD